MPFGHGALARIPSINCRFHVSGFDMRFSRVYPRALCPDRTSRGRQILIRPRRAMRTTNATGLFTLAPVWPPCPTCAKATSLRPPHSPTAPANAGHQLLTNTTDEWSPLAPHTPSKNGPALRLGRKPRRERLPTISGHATPARAPAGPYRCATPAYTIVPALVASLSIRASELLPVLCLARGACLLALGLLL